MTDKIKYSFSDRCRHFFHEVSNVRPIYWICVYVALIPIFALIYWALPDSQLRIPDPGGTHFGSWLYYSTVTISTLGFGDYTPAHGWAQAITAIEVLFGLSIFGFFLNSVGSMKTEIDITNERERQRLLHEASEKEKLVKMAPVVLHNINTFLAYCFAVTTPYAKRTEAGTRYNPDFKLQDMADLYRPSRLPIDHTHRAAIDSLIRCARSASLFLDSFQTLIDLSIWPELLENCFAFVASCQMFSSHDDISQRLIAQLPQGKDMTVKEAEEKVSAMIAAWQGPVEHREDVATSPIVELYYFIKETAGMAMRIETEVTQISAQKQ